MAHAMKLISKNGKEVIYMDGEKKAQEEIEEKGKDHND
jgi:hypothetical protein